MPLSMKDRFARLDLSKLPASYKSEFDEMSKNTYGFTDEDLNDVFIENFNEMYALIEQKYPDAIKTGGTLKKVKPAKVKKIKAKSKRVEDARDFLANLTPAQKKIMDSRMRKKLSNEDIEFIESTLRNDEASTDEELVEHFVSETKITEEQAKKWVALRGRYLAAPVEKSISYSERTKLKKGARKEKDIVKTRDGKEFDRRSKKNIGKTFYDENGKAWKCKGYHAKLDECIFEDSDGKEISSCLKDMYVSNPVTKREKGNLVDECKETLKEAGYTVRVHKAGTKRIKRSIPRPEKEIIKERVAETFTPILKDISGSEEKAKENKDVIAVLERVQALITKLFNRISNLADDGKTEAIEKIEKLLKEIID
jgi:hypothetical protein